MNAERLLMRARTQLVMNEPFFGVLALKLKVNNKMPCVGTMATDGVHLFYDDKFVEELPFKQLLGVVAHEVLHCAMLHMLRRENRDHRRFNEACDYAVNWVLTEKFNFELPKDGLLSSKYANMSAEQIYPLLQKESQESNAPSWGQIIDAAMNGMDEAQAKALEVEWDIAMKQAVQAAKQAGKTGGGWIDEIVELSKPRIPWREQLFNFLTAKTQTDFAWYPPDITYIQHRLHIPTLNAPSLGHVLWIEDTSGSVATEELAMSRAEIQSMMEILPAETFRVIQCDTEIRFDEIIEDFDELGTRIVGRGGTLFKPAMDKIAEYKPDVVIFFSDLEPCDGFFEQPDCDIIWLRTQDKDAPYGNHVDLFLGG